MRKTVQRTRLKRVDPIKKCHIKKGDTVIIISGKEKDKTGEVLKVIKKYSKAVVKGINIKKAKIYDFSKKKKNGKFEFSLVARESPLHLSKLMYYDESAGIASRLGRVIVDGVKKRVIKKTGKII